MRCIAALSTLVAPLLLLAAAPAARAADAASALSYLDGRADYWISERWSFVTGGTCGLSCHTTMPYFLVRSQFPDGGDAVTAKLRSFIENRVNHWDTVEPLYDFAPETSRSVEAAFNGLALSMSDIGQGRPLSTVARRALANAIDAQLPTGDWNWMNELLAPFEDVPARYWGSAFIAKSLALLPPSANVDRLDQALARSAQYLNTNFDRANLHGQMMAALAGAARPALLDEAKRRMVVTRVQALQRADGGWALASLGSWGVDPATRPSDGYATGLAAMVLVENGVSPTSAALVKARQWLESNQDADGRWPNTSLNSPGAEFNNGLITDASTSYALLALKRLGATLESVEN